MLAWPHNKLYWDPVGNWEPTFLQHRGYRGTQVGVGNLDFCNIVGPKWELGIWEFIARNDIVGGHLGKQKHCVVPTIRAAFRTGVFDRLPPLDLRTIG